MNSVASYTWTLIGSSIPSVEFSRIPRSLMQKMGDRTGFMEEDDASTVGSDTAAV